MQHIVHIFIGEELVSFRDQFASVFRHLNKDIKNPYFTALTLTACDRLMKLSPDDDGDSQDEGVLAIENADNDLYNYFQNLYHRKVTVQNKGNESLVVVLWVKLFLDNNNEFVRQLVGSLSRVRKVFVEVCGFSHDSVSCFIPNSCELLDANIYKKNFKKNIEVLKELRPNLSSLRLVANVNTQGVSLNFNEEMMARVCSEYAAIMCNHYLVLRQSHINPQEYPIDSFGLSSIVFDRDYYKEYLKNKIFVDVINGQGIENRKFLLNKIAQVTDPILDKGRRQLYNFYDTTVADVKAMLALSKGHTATHVVAGVDNDLNNVINGLKEDVDNLLRDGNISIFEKEAIISLILGDDCAMFESSAVPANEIIIDDVIDSAMHFFVDLDREKNVLFDVSQNEINAIRTSMRNTAVAKRKRQNKLEGLSITQEETKKVQIHIEGGEYKFEDKSYKLDLEIDPDPLERTYKPHPVSVVSVDLRDLFGEVRDQGNQGSCASFAISSVIEALRRDKRQYSPAFLYWNAREIEGLTNEDSGASIYGVLKVATEKGICQEILMPYNPIEFKVRPSENAYEDASKCKVLEAQTVEIDIETIKSALSDGFPVIIAAKIFDSFSSGKNGFVPIPSEEEIIKGNKNQHGHHALVLCGFYNDERVFVARNSWGNSFGDGGYCFIPYSYAKRFITQACIISAVSNSESSNTNLNKTLNFTIGDIDTEAEILKVLISEDNYELMLMSEKSDDLKRKWIKNIATLQNVNVQNRLVAAEKSRIQGEIDEKKVLIRQLQTSKNDKIKDFKNSHIKGFVLGSLFTMASVVLLLLFISIVSCAIFGVSAIVLIYLIVNYEWKLKLYKQELNDEIQGHSNLNDKYIENIASLDLNSHINGKILNDIDEYKNSLRNKKNLICRFNNHIVELYDRTKDKLVRMTPVEPYPFIGVLMNENLDRYYNRWRDRMISSIDLNNMLSVYDFDSDIEKMLNNEQVRNEILRGLNKFGLKEYLNKTDVNRWQFLPNTHNLSDVVQELDSKAMPFCPYEASCMPAKYLLVKGMNSDEMHRVGQYFSQKPSLILTNNPDVISVVNVEWYGYDQILN